MSVSLLVSAAYLDELPAASKLVLMALADSADDDGAGSIPGLAKLRAWSGLGKSRTLEVLAELIAAGWVVKTTAGRRGQRATFHVFPRGVPSIPSASDVEARYGSAPPDPGSSSPGNPQVGTTADVVHSPPDSGSAGSDAMSADRVRSDPPQGPAHRTPSLLPFGTDRATPSVRTAPVVDNRRGSAVAGQVSNNGQAERPVAEVLAATRRTKPADPTAYAASVRERIAATKAARQPTAPEEPAP